MHVRMTRATAQSGKLDELADRWTAWVGHAHRLEPGLRTLYLAADRGSGDMVIVSVWDAKPDETAIEKDEKDFLSEARDLVSGEPSTEGYDVLEHVHRYPTRR